MVINGITVPDPTVDLPFAYLDNKGINTRIRQYRDICGMGATKAFTRNSPKNSVDRYGRFVESDIDKAVVDYRNGVNLGYTSMPESSNGILNSRNLNNWAAGGNITSQSYNIMGIDGRKITVVTTGSIGFGSNVVSRTSSIILTTGQRYTFSFLAEKTSAASTFGYILIGTGGVTDIGSSFNVQTLDSIALYSGGGGNWDHAGRTRRITNLGNNVYLCEESVTFTGASGTYSLPLYMTVLNSSGGFTAEGLSGAIASPQFEPGSKATSRILTDGASVNTSADALFFSGAEKLLGQKSGAIYVEINTVNNASAVIRSILELSDGTVANRIIMRKTLADRFEPVIIIGGETQCFIQSPINQQGRFKILQTYGIDRFEMFSNSVKMVNTTSNVVPTLSRIDVANIAGTAKTNQFIDPIADIKIWSSADWITDNIARAITA